MKKLRIVLLTAAIVTAIGSAYATSQVNCTYYTQYKKIGPASYLPAGEFGYNYYCIETAGYCTYYKPNPQVEVYYPCRIGLFQAIFP